MTTRPRLLVPGIGVKPRCLTLRPRLLVPGIGVKPRCLALHKSYPTHQQAMEASISSFFHQAACPKDAQI
jgi:hypothetical protein